MRSLNLCVLYTLLLFSGGPEPSRTSVRGLQLLVRLDEVHVRDPLTDQLRDAVADVDLQQFFSELGNFFSNGRMSFN